MAIEKKHEEEHENEERWLLTYADLITLLMVFFVVMYSMSKTDAAKFEQMAETLKAAFTNPMGSKVGFRSRRLLIIQSGGGKPEETETGRRGGTGRRHHSQALEKLRQRFQDLMQRTEGMSNTVHVAMNQDETALIVRLSDSLLFEPGSAELTDSARAVMDKVAKLLKAAPNQIRVEGHTDNIPINNAKYQSNWELSTARAVNVLRYLIDVHHFPPQKLSAGGYGEYRPVEPNDTPEHRAANRRVEFVILDEPSETSGSEPSSGSAPPSEPSPSTAAPSSNTVSSPAPVPTASDATLESPTAQSSPDLTAPVSSGSNPSPPAPTPSQDLTVPYNPPSASGGA